MAIRRALSPALLLAALPASAQSTFVESFEGGSNTGGWSWGTGNETIVPLNGNPGAYLQDLTLSTCCPQAATAPGDSSIFTGDYRARGVSSLGIDLITLAADFGVGGRPLSVVLVDDGGTPQDFDDDALVWFVGDTNVPGAGVPIRTGWTPFDFAIPADSPTLPADWTAYTPDARTGNQVWNDVITDVDGVSFFYGDPAGIFPFFGWDVGLDNPRITYALDTSLPVHVPFDGAEYRGWTILGFQDSVFEPEGGNPGAHLNFDQDNFFVRVYNASDPSFVGDFSRKGRVQISADLRWRTIRFGNTNVQRDLFFMIWDEYVDENGVERKHVLLRPLGKVRGTGPNAPWRTSTVRLPDPSSDDLPGGWYYWPFDGAVEPSRTLPDGVSVAGILSSVDRVQWSTATPGLFFGFTQFDVSVDNCAIEALQGGGNGGPVGQPGPASGSSTLSPGGELVALNSTEARTGVVPEFHRAMRLWMARHPLADWTTTGAQPGEWGYGIGDEVVDLDDLRYVWRLLRN